MKINKATVIFIILIIWVVFSLFYIINDVWQDFQSRYAQQALIQGREEGAMNAYGMVGQAAAKQLEEGCKNLIPLTFGKDESGKEIVVNLVNAECLDNGQEAPEVPEE